MKLKLNDDGYAIVEDGKPVYVADDGKDVAYDPIQMRSTITKLGLEAKTYREKLEKSETKLETFSGIEDPDSAIKAMETVANLDSKKLIDAGEVERVKTEIAKAYDEKISERDVTIVDLKGQLRTEIIGGAFSRSKFIADKMVIPADMVQASFGKNFKVEDGKIAAYKDGNRIFSVENIGEHAGFDEALQTLVDTYPNKNAILKGSGNSGSGSEESGGTGGEGTITRKEFDVLSPLQKATKAAEMNKGKLKIVD